MDGWLAGWYCLLDGPGPVSPGKVIDEQQMQPGRRSTQTQTIEEDWRLVGRLGGPLESGPGGCNKRVQDRFPGFLGGVPWRVP